MKSNQEKNNQEKEAYEKPQVEIIEIETEGILCGSGDAPGYAPGGGGSTW